VSALLPNVSEEMLEPKFWLTNPNHDSDQSSLRPLHQKHIAENSKALVSLRELRSEHQQLSPAEWSARVAPQMTVSDAVLYDKSGQELSSAFWDQVRSNAECASSSLEPHPGFAVQRANLRRWPTDNAVFKSPEDREFDRFQDTALHTFEPVYILSESQDGQWYYVISSTYRGWVLQQDIARCTTDEFQHWSQQDDIVIPTSNHVFTQAAPYDEAISKKWLEFAAYLPACNDSPDPLGNQTPVGNIAVYVAVRNAEGWLDVRKAFVSDRAAIHEGFLPYTRASVVTSAFALLTERYGWGDNFGNHDCSSLVMDVYRTIGLQLPRDTDEQEEALPNRLAFPESASSAERDQLLRSLHLGDPLYMPGHTMLYLGYVHGHHYVIHDFAGYTYMSDGELRSVPVNEIMVSTLDILTGRGKPYLEELTSGVSLFAQ
jgi:hypothetical protein